MGPAEYPPARAKVKPPPCAARSGGRLACTDGRALTTAAESVMVRERALPASGGCRVWSHGSRVLRAKWIAALKSLALWVLCFGIAAPAFGATEDEVLKRVRERFPQSFVEKVFPTPYPGIYEVLMDNKLFYTD